MKKTFIFVGILLMLLTGVSSSATSASSINEKDMFYLDPLREYIPGEVESWYVRYQPDQKNELAKVARELGGEVIYDLSIVDTLVINLPSQAIQSLSTNRAIAFYEPVPQHQLLEDGRSQFVTDAPANAPASGRVEIVPWNIDQYQVREIWDQNFDGIVDPGAPTGEGVKFCIIDTGLWREHEDFDWSKITGFSQISGQAWDTDGNGHGTHVAGTANAVQNGIGVVGVAPGGMELHIVKVFNNNGQWTATSNLGAAAQNCRDNGANVLSMSLGGGFSATEEAIFQALYDNDNILNIAAAGNDGNAVRSYPASYDSVISVAAIDRDEVVATFSQYPSTSYDPNNPPANVEWDVVELSGGGVNVLSTWPAPPNTDIPRYEVNTIDSSNDTVNAIEGTANGSAEDLLVDGGLCTSTNGAWNGRIVLCERGSVSFADKVNNVRNSGGLATIIFNNEPGGFDGTCGGGCDQPSIPAVSMSQADGLDLRDNYLNTMVEVVSDDGSNCATCVGGYNAISGTSMATPGVAAAVGFTWAACGGGDNPNVTNKDIRQLLRDTAKDLEGVHGNGGAYGAGWDRMTGWGLVQLKDALDLGAERFGATNCPPVGQIQITPATADICTADDPSFDFAVAIERGDFTGNYDMSADNVPVGAGSSFSPNPILNPDSATTFTLNNLNNATEGSHDVTIIATDASDPDNQSQGLLTINLAHQSPSAPALSTPANGSSSVATIPQFIWDSIAGASSYSIEIATDAGFNNIVDSATGLTDPNYTPDSPLAYATTYYWRVYAVNACGSGAASGAASFTTMAEPSEVTVCVTPNVAIPDSNAAGVNSTLTFNNVGNITDVNLYLRGTHTWVGDLIFTLTHPNGTTSVTAVDRPGIPASTFGCSSENFDLWLDDDGPDGPVEDQCFAPPALRDRPTPNNPLSAFNGLEASGVWTLNVSDNAGGDTGTLQEWCVEIAVSDPIAPPSIEVEPESIAGGQAPDVQTNHPLTITNTGEADLIWTIHEASPASINDNPERILPSSLLNPVTLLADSRITPLANVVSDGGFEGGTPNPDWSEGATNFDTPLCTSAICGTGGGTGPRNGLWWAWFGGMDAAETGFVSQIVTLDSGAAELGFWLEIPAASGTGNDFLEVSLGGDVIFTVTDADQASYATYTYVSVDVSAYAGGTHLLSFDSSIFGGGITSFFVDDVALDSEPVLVGCDTPQDIDWLSVSVSNGTTAANSSSVVDVTFDSTGLDAGDYSAILCIDSNDPAMPRVEVPVALTVFTVQVIELHAGWNIISSHILPDEANMADVMAAIADDVILVKNGIGQFYVPGVFNGIGDWQWGEGYLVEMVNPRTLVMVGEVIPETAPISLGVGWHAITYLPAVPMDAADALASINGSFSLVKNDAGQFYVPGVFNGIGNLMPGQGYLIEMTTEDMLIYPTSD